MGKKRDQIDREETKLILDFVAVCRRERAGCKAPLAAAFDVTMDDDKIIWRILEMVVVRKEERKTIIYVGYVSAQIL